MSKLDDAAALLTLAWVIAEGDQFWRLHSQDETAKVSKKRMILNSWKGMRSAMEEETRGKTKKGVDSAD